MGEKCDIELCTDQSYCTAKRGVCVIEYNALECKCKPGKCVESYILFKLFLFTKFFKVILENFAN